MRNHSKDDDYSKEDDFFNAKLFAFDEKGAIKIHIVGGLSSTSSIFQNTNEQLKGTIIFKLF